MDVTALLSLVVWLVVVGLLWWAVTTVIGVIPMAEPIKTVVRVILIVVLCLIVLQAVLALIPGVHFPRLIR